MEHSNKVVQGLWIGPRLSAMEELSIRSFLANGHEYHLYTYGDVSNIPEGTIVRDANDIIAANRIFRYRDHDSYAGFSNHFRYRLLEIHGGWWVDLDLICLRPFDFEADYVFSSEHTQSSGTGARRVNVGAIKSPAGSALMKYLREACESRNPADLVWGEIGPSLFGEGVQRFGLESHVSEPDVFCPVPWFSWKDIIDPDTRVPFIEETHAVHLWNEMWRREGFSRDERYDPACLYELLRETYGTPVVSITGGGRRFFNAPAPADVSAAVPWPSVSAVVLSKNGSGRLRRCLESICRTGFADEIVVCVDSHTTDDTFRIARAFTPNVHVVKTAGYVESALAEITALCSCDFVLRIDDDETLAGNWDKASFQLLATTNALTQVWIPTRWVIPPGDSFIASAPWFPDPHPRLYVNDPELIVWPRNVHEHLSVSGRSLSLYDRWINHYNLVDRTKGERQRRCAKYRELNPRHIPDYYLYENQQFKVLPLNASAMTAAAYSTGAPLSTGRQYAPADRIDFSSSGNSVDYLGRGWGQPEDWGTWTLGHEAEIWLPLAAPLEGSAVVEFEVAAYLNPEYPTLRAELFCRDTLVGQWVLESREASLSAEIPAHAIAGDSRPCLRFRTADPRSPVDAGDSADSRLLALGFKSLRLRPLQQGAETPAQVLLRSRSVRPGEAFVNRVIALGRRALPGVAIDAFWEGMWIFRVDGYYFPLPDVTEPEAVPWKQLAGSVAQYASNAQDYWYYTYQPKPGDVVVDIGAGRGEDTFAFSRSVGKSGKVIAIEPHPVSFSVLNRFRAWNDLSNVTALNVACVSKPGRLQIETLPNWQSNYVTDAAPTPTSFPVEGVTFDYLWKKHGLERIDLLKMNIEGAEREALPGARRALEQARSVCVAAHDFRADRGESEWFRTGDFVRQFLRECGFRIIPRPDPRDWARDHIHGTRPE